MTETLGTCDWHGIRDDKGNERNDPHVEDELWCVNWKPVAPATICGAWAYAGQDRAQCQLPNGHDGDCHWDFLDNAGEVAEQASVASGPLNEISKPVAPEPTKETPRVKDSYEFYDKIYHPQTGKPPATWEFADAYAQYCGGLAKAERDAARDLVIKLEGRYQDVLKKLDELQEKIAMLTTPDPDVADERGFYDGF